MVEPSRFIPDFVADSRKRGSLDALLALTSRLAAQPVDAWRACAAELVQAADAAVMRGYLAAALARWPQDAELRFMAADQLWQLGETESAQTILHELLQADPAQPRAITLLAKVRQSEGKLEEASALMARVCRMPGAMPESILQGAQFIQQCQRQRLALTVCEEVIARGNPAPALLALAGNLARELGEFDQARTHYHAALAGGVDLNRWFVPGSLAATRRFTDTGDADFALLESQARNSALSPRARAATLFGLAKACDDFGDYARAASVLREANATAGGLQSWSVSAWNDFVRARPTAVSSPALAAHSNFVPIFVVGLPRTGTTLASVQIARSANVRDRGELPMLPFIAQRLIDEQQTGNRAALEEAAQLYLAHMRQDDAPAAFYIDQNPLNFRYLGLIAPLFPNARIVHCVRDRRDTALSIYAQFFANADYGFACAFDAIAGFASGHDELMRHWQAHLSLPIHTLRYETLVGAPDAALAALRTFTGVSVEHADTSTAAITSASLWQARQPIHHTSVGRWRNYREHFPELTALFGAE